MNRNLRSKIIDVLRQSGVGSSEIDNLLAHRGELRDDMAQTAMHVLLSRLPTSAIDQAALRQIAETAYEVADIMLRVRNQ